MASDLNNTVKFNVILLAGGRGADDLMAKAFDIEHKCLLDIAGTPMIMRVLNSLRKCPAIDRIAISIENEDILKSAPGFSKLPLKRRIMVVKSARQVSQSVTNAIKLAELEYPILITTADHALLTVEMLNHFCTMSVLSNADVTVGLAHEDVVKMAYPKAKRTFFRFSDGKFSGCNMFALLNKRGLNAISFWKTIERQRKRPWRIVKAFGIGRLATYLGGMLSLTRAMDQATELVDARVEAIRIPFAEAAIDVDKPEDLELVHEILASRKVETQFSHVDLDARSGFEVENDFDEENVPLREDSEPQKKAAPKKVSSKKKPKRKRKKVSKAV